MQDNTTACKSLSLKIPSDAHDSQLRVRRLAAAHGVTYAGSGGGQPSRRLLGDRCLTGKHLANQTILDLRD